MTESDQQHLFAESPAPYGPVECLGLTFENDIARRAYFFEKLREKLQDPEFRQIEGFPLGSDDDILALSDPPYYTACPNPFLQDFARVYGTPCDPAVPYHKEPFAADVSEGKSDPIYNAHSYHTKVPHKAIMRYILHYTQPGDVVLDGFCGTGMTGVAAQLCGDKRTIQELGYLIDGEGNIYDPSLDNKEPFSILGARQIVLNDLSPAATFISSNYNAQISVEKFQADTDKIVVSLENEYGWMYETLHSNINTHQKNKGKINYTVWSDVFVCPLCSTEMAFWDVAVDKKKGQVKDSWSCPTCNAILAKHPSKGANALKVEHAWETIYDNTLHITVRRIKQKPVLINYRFGNKNFDKDPDQHDLDLIKKIDDTNIPDYFPVQRMPDGDESRRNDPIGITHAHLFFTKRNLALLAAFWEQSKSPEAKWIVSGILQRANKQHQIAISRVATDIKQEGGKTAGHRRGTLYIPSNQVEYSIFELYKERQKVAIGSKKIVYGKSTFITTNSSTKINMPSECVDYIFVDPPFGSNIMYSELNFLWESWLKVFTNNSSEAIVNKTQGKKLYQYAKLMEQCFREFYRLLKPGRWITVEFHNSQNSVWNAIQESLQSSGFVVADVRTLDKVKKTHTQVTASGSVKQDLVITAYKPNGGLEERFKLQAGTVDGAWDFIQTHLRQLPVAVIKNNSLECLAERMAYLLYDRMLAFHVQHGILVPISAAEFYAGLEQRFAKRDDMFFLPEQVVEYDKKRLFAREVQQIPLIVVDEADAIQWLRQALSAKPQTYSDLYTQFVNQLQTINKHEKLPELSQLLEQNFLRYDGVGDLPSQIHTYLSSNFKELHGLPSEHLSLRQKAKDSWYVPDPNKSADLEKVREKALLKEFEEYIIFSGRELKQFRLEAVRVGFRESWQEKDYPTIIKVAQKIPDDVLQEDPKLLMWYDQALTRSGN